MGRHGDSELVRSFVTISKMACAVAILKNCHRYLLPNGKSDLVETWWKASGQHEDSELKTHSVPTSKMAIIAAEIKHHLLQNGKSD